MRQAGRSLPGVPRDPEDPHALRGLLRARALRRGDAAAGAPPRRGRGGDVRRHHAAAARDGRRRRARRERRAGDRPPDPLARRRRAPDRPRAGGVGAVHPRGGLDRAPRAARRPGRDRLLRRPLHGRRLPDRGQAEPRVPEREADDVRRAGDLARADGEAHRRVLALRPRQGARGRRRDPALRLLGRRALAGRLRGVRPAVLGAHPRRRRLPRRSTSAPAPQRCWSRCATRAAT